MSPTYKFQINIGEDRKRLLTHGCVRWGISLMIAVTSVSKTGSKVESSPELGNQSGVFS